MLVKREQVIVNKKTYSLGSEEIEALNTTAQIIKRLFDEDFYELGDEWNTVDYMECVDFIKTIIRGNNFTQIIER